MTDFPKVAFTAIADPQMQDEVGWLRRLNRNIGILKAIIIPVFRDSIIPSSFQQGSNFRLLCAYI